MAPEYEQPKRRAQSEPPAEFLTFALEVELGNDAMQTGADVADLLRRTADAIEESRGDEDLTGDHGNVSDSNGNRVGGWTVRRRPGVRP